MLHTTNFFSFFFKDTVPMEEGSVEENVESKDVE